MFPRTQTRPCALALTLALCMALFPSLRLAAQPDCNACPKCPGCPGCPDPFEPNGSLSGPTWSLLDASYASYLCEQDVDYWKLPDLKGGQTVIVTLADEPNDYDLTLIGPAGDVRYSSRPGHDEEILYTVDPSAAGTYHARVGLGRGLKADTGRPYTIAAAILSCRLDEYDQKRDTANDDPSLAVPIDESYLSFARAALTICPRGDQDFFAIELQGEDEVTVHLGYTHNPGWFGLQACLLQSGVTTPLQCLDEQSPKPLEMSYKVPAGEARKRYLVRVRSTSYQGSPQRPEYDLVIVPKRKPLPPPPTHPCPNDALYEPNDQLDDVRDPTRAWRFRLNPGEERRSYICTGNDVDTWSFEARRDEVLQVHLEHPREDYALALFNPRGRQVTTGRPLAGHRNVLSYLVDETGTWFVTVEAGRGAADQTAPYTLKLESTSCPDLHEPNDDFDHAVHVFDDNRLVFGRICHIGDVDTFKFQAYRHQQIFLDLRGRQHFDFEMALYGPDYRQIAADQSRIEHRAVEGGDHYLVVRSRSGQQYHAINPYSFSILRGGVENVPEVDLRVLEVELNQSIQSLDYDLPLFTRKPTLARVFAEVLTPGTLVKDVEAYLSARLDGRPLKPSRVRCGSPTPMIAGTRPEDLRAHRVYSPDCPLPARWLEAPGTLEVTARIRTQEFLDPEAANDSKVLSVKLENPGTFELQLVPLRDHCSGPCRAADGPPEKLLETLPRLTRSMYPVADIRIFPAKGWIELQGTNIATALISLLRQPPQLPVTKETLRLLVAREKADNEVTNGNCLAQDRIGFVRATPRAKWTLAHELGHCLGMGHADDGSTGPPFEPCSYCGTKLSAATDWRSHWGVDLHESSPVVMAPHLYADIMSYEEDRWASYHTYRKLGCLIEAISLSADARSKKCAGGRGLPQLPAAPAPEPERDYVVVSGFLDGAARTVFWADSERLRGDQIDVERISPPGPYLLRALDGAGGLVAERSFALWRDPEQPEQGIWTVAVPADPGIARFAVVGDDAEIGSFSVSATVPEIGAIDVELDEDTVTLRYEAADADGDALRATVELSSDGGLTWESVAAGLTADVAAFSPRFWPRSEQARLRLVVSDGFHSATAVSAPFTVAESAPAVRILTPQGDATVAPGEPVLLTAWGYDAEDGHLPPAAFTWSSERDGVLGDGDEIWVSALSPGRHELSVRVVDRAGRAAVDRLEIVVEAPAPAELPDLVVALEGPSQLQAGQDLTGLVELVVRNAGDATAVGSLAGGYMVDLVLSRDDELPQGWSEFSELFREDALLPGGRVSATSGLEAGAEATYGVEAVVPADTPPGRYCLGAVVDPGAVVEERTESNNTACLWVAIGSPD